MAIITCWQDIEDRGSDWLTPAEKKLIAACRVGEECVLSDGRLPPEGTPDPERRVRAEVLRYLILGGCERCKVQGSGVRVTGAYVEGQLDLSFQTAKGLTELVACHFEREIVALQSRFEFLILNGSHLPSLNAQGVIVTNSIFLKRVLATRGVRLPGASIGGRLDCTEATFTGTNGHRALNTERATIAGEVHLTKAVLNGEVSLAGISIGGQLDCDGAIFRGAKNGRALLLQGADVGESLFWREVKTPTGWIDLSTAHVGDLADDPKCWPEQERLILNGFTYDRIIYAPTDADTRLKWLSKGDAWGGAFFPQPYTQLAKVLQEMGHDRDARKVLARREQKIQADMRRRLRVELDGSWRAGVRSVWLDVLRPLLWVWDLLLRWVVGYGHHPFRSLLWLLGLWAAAVWLAHMAWTAGDFAPNSGPVQMSERWQALAVSAENPALIWSSTPEAGRDWETFNRYGWAADLVIPIIDLGQTAAWAPSTARGAWGRRLWRCGFLLQMAGWIVTALGAAAITGIIRRD